MVRRFWIAMMIAIGICAGPVASVRADLAEIIFVVDESGSMSGEHSWLGGMVTQLDAALNAAGVTGNRYGLVGFGGASTHLGAHSHLVGGNLWGTAAQLATATGGLLTNGGTEDGWDGINFGLNYTFTAGSRRNIILITDEDRDVVNNTLTYNNVLAKLLNTGAILNAVVDATYTGGAIGVSDDGTPYYRNGSGGYTVGAVGSGTAISGFGTTIANYVNMAWATGGAGWNLNILRNGGNDAASFTKAFIDIKVQEITSPVPVPAGVYLAGIGFACIMGYRRVSRKPALA